MKFENKWCLYQIPYAILLFIGVGMMVIYWIPCLFVWSFATLYIIVYYILYFYYKKQYLLTLIIDDVVVDKYCSYCTKKLRNDINVCEYCGAVL